MERVQYSQELSDTNLNPKKGVQKNFVLPVAISDLVLDGSITDALHDSFQNRVCVWAWCELHNIGSKRHANMKDCATKMDIPKHKNTGKSNRKNPLKNALESARNKLKWSAENLACTFATKNVKDVAGLASLRNNSRDDGEKLVLLPPNTTMRGLWLDWIRERGWNPLKTCRNRKIYRKKDEWTRSRGYFETQKELEAAGPVILTDGNILPPQVSKTIIVFECFRQLWRREFPHLKVCARGEDTCMDC